MFKIRMRFSGALRAFRTGALRRHGLGHIQAGFDAAPSGCIVLVGDAHAALMPRPIVPRPVLNAGIAGATARSCGRALDLLRAPLPALLAVLIIGTNDIRARSALSKAATDDFFDGTYLRDYTAVAARIASHVRTHFKSEPYLDSALPGFDEEYYRSWYADTCRYPHGLARHYLDLGWREGRDPSGQFSTDGYLEANADVRAAGVNPLIHFLEVGFAQGRTGWQKPHPRPTRSPHGDPDA